MGEITGLTAARMLAIEAASIVDGEVNVSGHLILTKHDSTPIDAGKVVGDQGPQGIQGVQGIQGEQGIQGIQGIQGETGPTGSVIAFAGSSAPSGWLMCDGSSLLREDYLDLFAIIGTTYGSVDGTHFTLPNLKGKVPVGLDSSQTEFDTLGETGGAKTHTLTSAEMPAHTHTGPSHTHGMNHNHILDFSGPGTSSSNIARGTTGDPIATNGGPVSGPKLSGADKTSTDAAGTGATGSTGTGGAHNNLQPYIVLNYIIKT